MISTDLTNNLLLRLVHLCSVESAINKREACQKIYGSDLRSFRGIESVGLGGKKCHCNNFYVAVM